MYKPKKLLISGLIGFAVFYLIASGCAQFDFGGIKKKVEGKLDLCPGTKIQTVYLDFIAQTEKKWFETYLRKILVKNGYQLVDDAAKADLELRLEYSPVVKKKRSVLILFLVPFFSSSNVEGLKVKSTFITEKCSRNKVYQAENLVYINTAIITDLKNMESEE